MIFFKDRGSLFLKGEPGTGKTLLALRIAEEFENSFYVSTRVSPEDLFEFHPYLRDVFSEEKIIDVAERSFLVDARRSAIERGG